MPLAGFFLGSCLTVPTLWNNVAKTQRTKIAVIVTQNAINVQRTMIYGDGPEDNVRQKKDEKKDKIRLTANAES